MILDHNTTVQLWDDPLFWELVPWASSYREKAEELLAEVAASQSALSLINTDLYNQWHDDLLLRAQQQPESLQSLIDYIRKRRRRKEEIRIKTQDGWLIF